MRKTLAIINFKGTFYAKKGLLGVGSFFENSILTFPQMNQFGCYLE
jgi:hypothetical protein